jgi:hypothetical protein
MKTAVLATVAMLFGSLLEGLPSSYFILLRWAVSIVSAFALISMIERRDVLGWRITFVIILLLFNPILLIHLDRELWQIIDVITGITLLLSLSAGVFTAVSPNASEPSISGSTEERSHAQATAHLPVKSSSHTPISDRVITHKTTSRSHVLYWLNMPGNYYGKQLSQFTATTNDDDLIKYSEHRDSSGLIIGYDITAIRSGIIIGKYEILYPRGSPDKYC